MNQVGWGKSPEPISVAARLSEPGLKRTLRGAATSAPSTRDDPYTGGQPVIAGVP